MGAQVAIGTVGRINRHVQESKEAEETRRSARESLALSLEDLDARSAEERIAAAINIRDTRQQVRASTATASASAAEAGVSGVSVDLLRGDFARQGGEAVTAIEANRDSRLAQIQRQERGVRAQAQSRINQAQGPSVLNTGLEIASRVVGGINTADANRRNRFAAAGG